jgi:hypothetical protein
MGAGFVRMDGGWVALGWHRARVQDRHPRVRRLLDRWFEIDGLWISPGGQELVIWRPAMLRLKAHEIVPVPPERSVCFPLHRRRVLPQPIYDFYMKLDVRYWPWIDGAAEQVCRWLRGRV